MRKRVVMVSFAPRPTETTNIKYEETIMKNLKRFAAAAVIALLTVAIAAFALVGCGAQEYTFEAEDAVLEGMAASWGAPQPMSVETGPVYSEDGEGEEVTVVGNFNQSEQSITWTVTSSKECDADLTLFAASASMTMDMTTYAMGLAEITGDSGFVSITNNDGTAITLSGTLPGLEGIDMSDTTVWKNVGSLTGKIHLVKGENKIVLKLDGMPEGAMSGGLNVDKLVIKASGNLTFEKTDNSDKVMG